MDKIDEYLNREHGVIAGACSSIESIKYTIAREVYLKTIDKMYDWLIANCWENGRFTYNERAYVLADALKDYMMEKRF